MGLTLLLGGALLAQAAKEDEPTATSVSSSLNASSVGQTVSFTASVAGGKAAKGEVTFKDGATPLATGEWQSNGAIAMPVSLQEFPRMQQRRLVPS